MEPFLGNTHLLNHLLHLASMLQLALDKLCFEALLYFRGQTELIVHTFVFIKDPVHVGTLGLLQMGRL